MIKFRALLLLKTIRLNHESVLIRFKRGLLLCRACREGIILPEVASIQLELEALGRRQTTLPDLLFVIIGVTWPFLHHRLAE